MRRKGRLSGAGVALALLLTALTAQTSGAEPEPNRSPLPWASTRQDGTTASEGKQQPSSVEKSRRRSVLGDHWQESRDVAWTTTSDVKRSEERRVGKEC